MLMRSWPVIVTLGAKSRIIFALLRPYYVARVLLAAESKFLYIAIAAVSVYGLIIFTAAVASTP